MPGTGASGRGSSASLSPAAGDRELGREVAAEALAGALERWSRVGSMASPGAWTHQVGLNLLRRHHRRRAIERRLLQRSAPRADVVEAAVAVDEAVDLWRAVAALPARERTAVGLRYGAGMTEPEIAAVLGIAPGTVSATLNHARVRLRTALTQPTGQVPHG